MFIKIKDAAAARSQPQRVEAKLWNRKKLDFNNNNNYKVRGSTIIN
jgi:hypothetical protein